MAVKGNDVHKDEMTLKELLLTSREWLKYLRAKKKWIIIFSSLGLVSGLAYALLTQPQYKASISFVTDTDNGTHSALNVYSGLASQLGINLGGSGMNNELFSGDNIFDLMKTRLMLQRTLFTSVSFDGKQSLLINKYIQVEKLREKKKSLRNVLFKGDNSKLTAGQSGAVKTICRFIVSHMDFKDGSIMTVNFTSRDEAFSQVFLNNLLENVQDFYISTKTKKARENLAVLQKQLDSVKNQLYGAMGNVASFQDFNQNLVRQGPRVEQQKNSMKVSINSAIYQQLVTGLETAKLTLQQETPLFEIIDSPILPLDKDQPSKLKWALAGIILGALLACGLLLIEHAYQVIMESES